ncbi:MAG: ABC transporter ATP-binding protein [Roseiflexus sp.]|jgi:ATP-binding cassette subfamily B protein|nr:ABC transporter ATP-binding protein [Roseiflexus sp.]
MAAGAHFDDDEILGKAYDATLVRRLGVFVAPYWRRLALATTLMFGGAAVELIPPFLVKQAIDGPIAARDPSGVLPIFGVYIVALLTAFGFRYGQTYIVQSVGQQVMVDIRTRIFSHIQRMSLAFFDRNPVGRLITRLTNDVDALNEFITQGTVALLGDLVRLLFIIMLALNWRLALISFIVFPAVMLASGAFQRIMRTIYRRVRQRIARINAFLNEQISGVLITQLFNREEQSRIRFAELSRDYLAAQLQSNRTFAVFFPLINFLSVTAMALILYFGGQAVLADVATLGMLVAFIQYTDQAFQPIRQIAERYNTFQSAMASAERIFRMLDTPATIVDPEHPRALPTPVRGEIAFENVWFTYDTDAAGPDGSGLTDTDDRWVLRGISFTIPAGQAVAVVGATGAGKTSLVSLMARFYDIQRGSIKLDGIDIRELRQTDLRRHVSAVPQDPVCFSGSIASNIRLYDESIGDEQVRRAAEIARAASFIERLPGSYDYEVRERGSNLSVGQRQLLAFARAIAFNPEVLLILDEATSSVDTETEGLIQEALERMIKGRTSIIIAHRLSTIRHADRILVLHKGRLVEDGSHDELLAKRGYYYRLYQLQFAGELNKN